MNILLKSLLNKKRIKFPYLFKTGYALDGTFEYYDIMEKGVKYENRS